MAKKPIGIVGVGDIPESPYIREIRGLIRCQNRRQPRSHLKYVARKETVTKSVPGRQDSFANLHIERPLHISLQKFNCLTLTIRLWHKGDGQNSCLFIP